MERSVSIHERIKKNNLPLFKTRTKSIPKIMQQTANLKSDCNLFGQLYITSMFCGGNLEEFLSHENHSRPPALSNNGRLYLPTKKSDLLNQLIVGDPVLAPLFYNAKIFDECMLLPHNKCPPLENTQIRRLCIHSLDRTAAAELQHS